jgi:hypothetical protein
VDESLLASDVTTRQLECPICFVLMRDPMQCITHDPSNSQLNGCHNFCADCAENLNRNSNGECPQCRRKIAGISRNNGLRESIDEVLRLKQLLQSGQSNGSKFEELKNENRKLIEENEKLTKQVKTFQLKLSQEIAKNAKLQNENKIAFESNARKIQIDLEEMRNKLEIEKTNWDNEMKLKEENLAKQMGQFESNSRLRDEFERNLAMSVAQRDQLAGANVSSHFFRFVRLFVCSLLRSFVG